MVVCVMVVGVMHAGMNTVSVAVAVVVVAGGMATLKTAGCLAGVS